MIAAALAFVLRRWSVREPADDPLAVAAGLDLLSACLLAGLPLATAVGAVAGTLHGAPRMRSGLRRAADLLALGGDAGAVWETLGQAKGLGPVARMARRSADSGSSLAAGAAELATATREQAGDRALIATERAGVAVSGPLGLCFLPAFLCLGIAPVVLGLAGKVLGGGVL
nr:type II secretion system F family protein [Tomitella biformata]